MKKLFFPFLFFTISIFSQEKDSLSIQKKDTLFVAKDSIKKITPELYSDKDLGEQKVKIDPKLFSEGLKDDRGKRESGNGLKNMEERCRIIGADLTIESQLEIGTSITITF